MNTHVRPILCVVPYSSFAANLKTKKRGLFLCCLFFSLSSNAPKGVFGMDGPTVIHRLARQVSQRQMSCVNGPSHTGVCLQSLSYLSLNGASVGATRATPRHKPKPPAGRPKPERRREMHARLSTPTPYPSLSTIHSNVFVSMMCACSGRMIQPRSPPPSPPSVSQDGHQAGVGRQ